MTPVIHGQMAQAMRYTPGGLIHPIYNRQGRHTSIGKLTPEEAYLQPGTEPEMPPPVPAGAAPSSAPIGSW